MKNTTVCCDKRSRRWRDQKGDPCGLTWSWSSPRRHSQRVVVSFQPTWPVSHVHAVHCSLCLETLSPLAFCGSCSLVSLVHLRLLSTWPSVSAIQLGAALHHRPLSKSSATCHTTFLWSSVPPAILTCLQAFQCVMVSLTSGLLHICSLLRIIFLSHLPVLLSNLSSNSLYSGAGWPLS